MGNVKFKVRILTWKFSFIKRNGSLHGLEILMSGLDSLLFIYSADVLAENILGSWSLLQLQNENERLSLLNAYYLLNVTALVDYEQSLFFLVPSSKTRETRY